MPKAFSLASWNVEHFKDDPTRIDRVAAFLKKQDPDVFALYEVEGKTVFSAMTQRFPGYSFHITEGPQVQEILVGVRGGLSAFFTQKLEYKSGIQTLRPGALLTVTVADKHYPMLFLHTKSGNTPLGLGIRDDMFNKACEFRKVLDAAANGGGRAHYLFMGDLNTMGMEYPFQKNVSADTEIKKLEKDSGKVKMRRLKKASEHTWFNGSRSSLPPSALDHVVAAEHLKFKKFGTAEVDLRGWPQLSGSARDQWIKDYSDHALLYLEVQKA